MSFFASGLARAMHLEHQHEFETSDRESKSRSKQIQLFVMMKNKLDMFTRAELKGNKLKQY